MRFLNADELEAGLPDILASPRDDGVVSMIVRRPDTDRREVLDSGELDVADPEGSSATTGAGHLAGGEVPRTLGARKSDDG